MANATPRTGYLPVSGRKLLAGIGLSISDQRVRQEGVRRCFVALAFINPAGRRVGNLATRA